MGLGADQHRHHPLLPAVRVDDAERRLERDLEDRPVRRRVREAEDRAERGNGHLGRRLARSELRQVLGHLLVFDRVDNFAHCLCSFR